jgi:hypothetical protein
MLGAAETNQPDINRRDLQYPHSVVRLRYIVPAVVEPKV